MYALYSVGRNQKKEKYNGSCNLPVRRRERVTAEVTILSQRPIRFRHLSIVILFQLVGCFGSLHLSRGNHPASGSTVNGHAEIRIKPQRAVVNR